MTSQPPAPRAENPAAPSRARRRLLQVGAVGAVAALGLARAALASSPTWPNRPLRLIVGFPAGSSPDEIARTLADPLARVLSQSVEVENRPGAGGLTAAATLARSDDDHTLGLLPSAHLTVARLLQPTLAYDPLTDLQPVSSIAATPLVLCASPRVSVTGAGAIRVIRNAGMAWHYGSSGTGTPFHLGMEMLKAAAGWQVLHVPYPGNPQVINALLQGDVQLALLPPSLTVPHWRTGRLPAVAVTTARRSGLLPGVPTLAERGLAGFAFEHWYGMVAPRYLAIAHAERLSRAVVRVLRDEGVRQRLREQGWQTAGSTPAQLARRIATDHDRLRPVIERQQIRMP